MELNPVAGLVLLSKASTISDDKPSLADLDSDSDEEDEQGTVVVNLVQIVFDQHKHLSKSELYKIEDITWWWEDMNFMFEWQEEYLTSERNERVRYCSCHENIKFISLS